MKKLRQRRVPPTLQGTETKAGQKKTMNAEPMELTGGEKQKTPKLKVSFDVGRDVEDLFDTVEELDLPQGEYVNECLRRSGHDALEFLLAKKAELLQAQAKKVQDALQARVKKNKREKKP
jgi:hypothetical protein